MNTVGEAIKYYRKNARLSQTQLAQKIAVKGASSISDWENNRFIPRYETLEKIAEALNVSVEVFTSIADNSEEISVPFVSSVLLRQYIDKKLTLEEISERTSVNRTRIFEKPTPTLFIFDVADSFNAVAVTFRTLFTVSFDKSELHNRHALLYNKDDSSLALYKMTIVDDEIFAQGPRNPFSLQKLKADTSLSIVALALSASVDLY